ncbi:MAG: ABC transporter substrate-binding protein [Chloroflexota bacterium]|nr:ABC transporter substrate-binding protein [Chloroflexota bacterium]
MTTERYRLRLMETFRTVFYTPIYVAVAGGYLESEGLDVDFQTCPSQFPHPLSALNHGAADIVQSGIMRSIIASDWGAEVVPRHFAEINSRDGFFVIGRQPGEAFQWADFADSTIIPVGFSPMPWASFQYALRNSGVALEGLSLMQGLGLNEAIEAFQRGQADFIHLPEPAAEQLLADGVGHLTVALGQVNGHIAYSSFAATSAFLNGRPDAVHRFVAGYSSALLWLAGASAAQTCEVVQSFFPSTDPDLITASIARYKEQGTWPATPHLGRHEYGGLQEILMAAGMVRQWQPYEKVVTTAFTEEQEQ